MWIICGMWIICRITIGPRVEVTLMCQVGNRCPRRERGEPGTATGAPSCSEQVCGNGKGVKEFHRTKLRVSTYSFKLGMMAISDLLDLKTDVGQGRGQHLSLKVQQIIYVAQISVNYCSVIYMYLSLQIQV